MSAERHSKGALERALGHTFARSALLDEALTHPGAAGARSRPKWAGGYERLEFLGDRVLGLIIAEMLLERFPKESEGELARRHAQLVRKETLVEVAGAISLGGYIKLGPSETEDARQKANLLADSCEALIAALYLDGGLEVARGFVRGHWDPRITASPPKDPKTALQEWALGRGSPLPIYSLDNVAGPPHEPLFTVSVRVDGLGATAKGTSKRMAETAAAAALMLQLPETPKRG